MQFPKIASLFLSFMKLNCMMQTIKSQIQQMTPIMRKQVNQAANWNECTNWSWVKRTRAQRSSCNLTSIRSKCIFCESDIPLYRANWTHLHMYFHEMETKLPDWKVPPPQFFHILYCKHQAVALYMLISNSISISFARYALNSYHFWICASCLVRLCSISNL